MGTFVSFVTYLDQVVEAPPNTIERRITGVTSEARRFGYPVPKEATEAARRALKPLRLDKKRQQRGRGKAASLSPADLRAMAEAPHERQPQPTARRRTVFRVPELARLRDQALTSSRLPSPGATRRCPSWTTRTSRPWTRG